MRRTHYNEDYQPEPIDRFERHVLSQKVVGERQNDDVIELDVDEEQACSMQELE